MPERLFPDIAHKTEMGRVMGLPGDIRDVLMVYQALGFERLPIKIGARGKGQGARSKRQDVKSEGLGFDASRITHHASRKKTALDALRKEIGDCQRCRLFSGRKNLVFGEGNPDARIMFIGEGPGHKEDIQGRPFVGDAGELLTRLIKKMGFKRDDVYIGNIVKCRPPMNRDPEEDEINACMPVIEKQIEIISPKAIISLGRIASHALTGEKTPITRLRGQFREHKGIPVMPTFHPAYLLRNEADKIKNMNIVWGDAQKVLEKLNIKEA